MARAPITHAAPGLTTLEEALASVRGHTVALPAQTVALGQALGRVLAEPVIAPFDVPGADNSAMDGYAIRAADSGVGVLLRVSGESRAGAPWNGTLRPGEACAISTGAVLPNGADAVIPVEQTRERDGETELAGTVEAGAHVRRAGDDLRVGQLALAAGVRLGPVELGVLAELGTARLEVGGRPRVAIVTTGDELVAVGGSLKLGEVYNSGALAIPALVERAGGSTLSVAHALDDPAAVRAALGAALDGDVVVVCGGMSVGAHDHVVASLESLGVAIHFAGVALKPGRPTLFGTRGRTLVFGLPGNPVSSFVTFLLFARPALALLSGEAPQALGGDARLGEPIVQERDRVQLVRVRLDLRDDGWWAISTGPQGSHILTSLLGAEGFALIPAGEGTLDAGTQVAIERL
ncbi:MAG: gephyrin-like molybdotransferase Glp [Solirubrobacteraceae bacterium]